MDYAALFSRILELSPFVATLFYFLFTIWNSMQKKDAALLDTMKEHSTIMLQVQEKSITAQNNSADSNRELAGAIGNLKEHISNKIESLKPQSTRTTVRTNSRRPTPVALETKPAQA